VEHSPEAIRVWKSGVKFAFGRKNKGKVGILSQLKNPSKFNDVHAQNNFFLAVHNKLLLPVKIRFAGGGDITPIH